MENSSKIIRAESREAMEEMQRYGSGKCLAGKEDDNSPPDDPKERAVLEEHLYWARMERQKLLALSAEADETIWNLTELARRKMQERDEARNQARMILASFHARNAETMMLPGVSHSRAASSNSGSPFDSTGSSRAFAPATAPSRPSREMMAMQAQHNARTGTGYCVVPTSGIGHVNLASAMDAYFGLPPLQSFTSLVQEPFDPDMFLVDAFESPQDAVPAAAACSSSSGSQKPVQWKGKSSVLRHAADHGKAP